MANRSLPAGRYFAAFLLIVAILYGLIYFTGSVRTPQLGLDLRGGTTVTLAARTPDGQAPAPEDLELARQIIEQRVNGLGVAEAEVVTEGDSNIVISVPGDNGDQARELGQTAQLRFRPVISGPEPATPATPESSAPSDDAAATDPAAATDGAEPTAAGSTDPAEPTGTAAPSGDAVEDPEADTSRPPVTQEEAAAEFATLTCENEAPGTVDRPDDFVASCSEDGTAKYLLGQAVVEGTDVTDATAGTRAGTGEWIVQLDFNSQGSAAWAAFTGANVGSSVGITLDGRVISAPTINQAIAGGTEISGSFTQESATDLANQLKYGALPLSFTQATAQSISTELGEEQLRAGLLAGALGIALVFLYSLVYYRLLGLVMIASLVLSGIVVYACLVLLGRQIGFTLSLAGIAGFIVALGITADSFVVYFERIKDEIREGRSFRSAVPRAWVRARRTILSADAVSFLAAAILYWLAIGDVKGFAFTLGMSTVLDLIVVFLFTHPLMSVLSRFRWFGSSRISGLGRVEHTRRPAHSPAADRDLVGAGADRSTS
ncbi:protein translocase subunit SecD [Blastococcus haudaquaticus]|uniref:Protein translocase subunit SecD n=1 Tax=Blastococcus haudaquaticus TaxID=1938745 RepID=A0A286H5W6_9ACTN|nr:protein translocase subunit SecD [Blastococcus haudaquaticus]SOE03190.1 preprotein translocase subunit SecD [Blastococcus haudaquaticus]